MRLKKADILLIGVLLLLAVAASVFMFATREVGGEAVVVRNGEEILRLPLNQDVTEVVEVDGQRNTVIIEGGKARVSEANCPDRVCVRTGEIQFAGETVVCLPHKLVVKIEGGTSQDIDTVAQ